MPVRKITIGGDAAKVLKRIAKKGTIGKGELRRFVYKELAILAPRAAGHVRSTQLGGAGAVSAFEPTSGAGAKQRKKRRTGNLARQISGRAVYEQGFPAFEVGLLRTGSNVLQYAIVQELGTSSLNPDSPVPDIRPKSAKSLAIPQKSALTPSGVPRYASPRDFPAELEAVYFRKPSGRNKNVVGKLVLKTELDAERGNAIAQDRPVDYRGIEAVYLLASHVAIRPGYFLIDGVQDYLPTMVSHLANALLDEFVLGRK